jgi:drug/metabolite transporter (DMT)-like permease
MPISRPIAGAAMVAGGAVLFAGKGVLVKHAYAHGVDTCIVMSLRMLLALPIFAWLAWAGGAPAPRGALVGAAALGVLGYGLASWLDFVGLHFIGVGLERMVLYLYPTLVVLTAVARGRKRIGGTAWLALAGTYAGVVLTWYGQTDGGSRIALGVALVAASATAYATFVVASDDGLRVLGASRFMSVAMCGATLAVAAHQAARDPLALAAVPHVVWLDGAILALLGTVAPALLLAEGQRRVGAERASIIGSVGPCATAVFAWAVLDERPGALALVGMGLTVGAATMLALAKAPGPSPVSAPAARAG